MMTRMIAAFAALLVAVVAFGAPARADQCTVGGGDQNAASFAGAVTTAIKTAWSCEGAYKILETCQLGSSGDNALSEIVLSKCEPRFKAKATAAVMAAYQKARDKCNQIAEKNQGSMYQGQAAVCLARAGRDFAGKYGAKR
ncbi:MAG TPA: hypothetical protein VIQ05_12575 [Tardiphaga sp.]